MTSAARQLLRQARGLAAPVPSPCISVCRMHPATGLCEGCFRTIDEIVAWGRLGDAAKLEVWQRLVQRAQAGNEEPTP